MTVGLVSGSQQPHKCCLNDPSGLAIQVSRLVKPEFLARKSHMHNLSTVPTFLLVISRIGKTKQKVTQFCCYVERGTISWSSYLKMLAKELTCTWGILLSVLK
jgi:hypothetical protein